MSDMIGLALLALVLFGMFLAWREDRKRHKRAMKEAEKRNESAERFAAKIWLLMPSNVYVEKPETPQEEAKK
jgi:hypothetical protein